MARKYQDRQKDKTRALYVVDDKRRETFMLEGMTKKKQQQFAALHKAEGKKVYSSPTSALKNSYGKWLGIN